MTTPMLMTEHPTEERLAEFVDNRLDAAIREPVTEHLTSCGECREIVLMATEFQAESNVTPGRFGGRRRTAAVVGLAAAAMIALVVVPPMLRPDVDDLVAAAQGPERRQSDGRLAGGFAHAEKPRTNRSGNEENPEFAAKANLYKIAEKIKASDGPHVNGLLTLLLAEKRNDFNDAVATLDEAYAKTSGEERDSVAIDLAAALIARARWSADDKDNERALDLSNDVLKRLPQSPEALWNRAVALGSLNRTPEALAAWDAYLKVDSAPDSRWAKEARERKATLASY